MDIWYGPVTLEWLCWADGLSLPDCSRFLAHCEPVSLFLAVPFTQCRSSLDTEASLKSSRGEVVKTIAAFPSTHDSWRRTFCNSSSRGSSAFFLVSVVSLVTHVAYSHTDKYKCTDFFFLKRRGMGWYPVTLASVASGDLTHVSSL